MPTAKLLKSVNLDPADHARAQRCADIITAQTREKLGDPEHPEYPIKRAIGRALELLEEALAPAKV